MMPLLPQKVCIGAGYFDEHLFAYTEDQMREYGKLCRKQALAEAADICDNEKWASSTGAHSIRFIDTYNMSCDDCARAIGRLV